VTTRLAEAIPLLLPSSTLLLRISYFE